MIDIDLDNKEAEQSILGIMMLDTNKILPIIAMIDKDDFMSPGHKLIYQAIVDLYHEGKPIDIVTVSELLRFNEQLDAAGGRDYITSLAENVITVSNYKNYCKIVLKYAKKRKLLKLFDTGRDEINSTDVDELAQRFKLELEEIIINRTSDNLTHILSGVETCVEQVDAILKSDDSILGLSTGLIELDKMLSGLVGGRLYILGARPAMGKGIRLDCNILTPNGWVKNKDIKLGDEVIGRDGKPTKVIGIYPQPLQDCYKIILKDGREIVCDAPHEWTVYSSKWNKERTFTTEELYQKLQCMRYQNRISLPRFTGDYGIEKEFIIPPYIMGVLIGDGCLSTGMIRYCKPSQLVLDNVRRYLPKEVEANFYKDGKTVGITNWKEATEYIKAIELNTQCYNKFIPQEYFHSSKAQREQLFQGLMDTDGSIRGRNSWEYSTSSERLAKDVQQLAWSLGYNCRIASRIGSYKKDGITHQTRLNYRLYITKEKPLTITRIEKVESIPTQCIHVDNEDKLFVIEDYLVTHNSALAQQIAECVASKPDKNVVFASLEMSVDEYTQRALFRRCNINQEMLTRRMVDSEKIFAKLYEESDNISKENLFIIDNADCTLTDIENGIVNCINKQGSCDLVVVDYLQLMSHDNRKETDDYKVVSYNSTGLKKLARKYNIPILALCQLSRSLEARADKHPILSDLRESGKIEQDADVVMFLFREEVYDPTPLNRGSGELIIAKQRQGRTGKIDLIFNAGKTEFTEGVKHFERTHR